jgi:hypothetical protein
VCSDPSQCDLRSRDAFRFGKCFDLINKLQVFNEVLVVWSLVSHGSSILAKS